MYCVVNFSLLCFLDCESLKGKDYHLFLPFGGALTSAYNKSFPESLISYQYLGEVSLVKRG